MIQGFILTALLVSLAIVDFTFLAGTPDIKWIQNADNDCNLNYVVGSDYTFFDSAWVVHILGIVLGSNITDHLAGHENLSKKWWKTPLWKRLIRAVISALWGYLIWYGFDHINCTETATQYTFIYIIPLFIVGITYTGLLPYLFSFVKLAHKYGEEEVELRDTPSVAEPYEPVLSF